MTFARSITVAVGSLMVISTAPLSSSAQTSPAPAAAPYANFAVSRFITVDAPAKSFRDPALRERRAFPTGSPIRFYIEPVNLTRNFVTKADGSKELQGAIVFDVEIANQAGRIIAARKALVRTPLVVKVQSPEDLKEFDAGRLWMKGVFANLKIDAGLSPGAYTIKVRVNDGYCAACSVEHSAKVTIEPVAAAR